MKAIILAAGVGSRLGKPYPKSMNVLPNGETILGRQIRIFRQNNIREIYIVVGFKLHLIMEKYPDVYYKYNPIYYITNTSKSLLMGIEDINDDVIWTNGDVIFDERIIEKMVMGSGNKVAVNRSKCDSEEVKYICDENGDILQISKEIKNAHGEAVGINKISKKDIDCLKNSLHKCNDNDYFEKGLEYIIEDGKKIQAIDISDYRCIEVDFQEDWDLAKQLFRIEKRY